MDRIGCLDQSAAPFTLPTRLPINWHDSVAILWKANPPWTLLPCLPRSHFYSVSPDRFSLCLVAAPRPDSSVFEVWSGPALVPGVKPWMYSMVWNNCKVKSFLVVAWFIDSLGHTILLHHFQLPLYRYSCTFRKYMVRVFQVLSYYEYFVHWKYMN